MGGWESFCVYTHFGPTFSHVLIPPLLFFLAQVTGVVGRAETLSSVFFLGAFLSYAYATKNRKATGKLIDFR